MFSIYHNSIEWIKYYMQSPNSLEQKGKIKKDDLTSIWNEL